MSDTIVISPKASCESAKRLAEALNADYENPYKTKNRDFTEYDNVFNYGFSQFILCRDQYNDSISIQTAIDKIKCLSLLKGKCKTVPMTLDRKEAENWVTDGKIVVARELVGSANGKGLHYCTTKEELDKIGAKFWTQYVDNVGELRVNVWQGEILSVYYKIITGDNFKFKLVKDQENHPQLLHIAKQVFLTTKLDWFGMDLLITDKGILHFLEVNSAPILYPYTLQKLVNAFKRVIN